MILLADADTDCRIQAEAELRAMHADVLRFHLEDNVDDWLAGETETVIVSSQGRLFEAEESERRAAREAYLAAAEFEIYRDMVEPVVTVSLDCSLGWVLVQVEVTGTTAGTDGERIPLRFQSSWVELYQRFEEGWLMVGNVSNFLPDAAEDAAAD